MKAIRWIWIGALAGVMTATVGQVNAQVRYGMQGETAPFNRWDHEFSTSAQGTANLGITLNVGKAKIQPNIGISAGHDSNVYMDTEGNEVEDFYWAVEPGIMFLYGENDTYLSANYGHEWMFYSDETTEDSTAHMASAAVQHNTGKTIIHISDQYRDKRGGNLEAGNRLTKKQNVLGGDVERVVSRKTSAGVTGAYEMHDYTSKRFGNDEFEVNREYIDYSEYRAGGRGYYRAMPKTDVFAEYAFGWVFLDQPGMQSANYVPNNRSEYGDAEYQEASLGLRGRPTPKTSVSGRVGYQWRTFDGEIAEIESWTSSARVQTSPTERLRAGCSLVRRFFPSITVAGDTVEVTRISPFVRTYVIGDDVSATLHGSYEESNFYNRTGETDREDRYWDAGGMVDWHLGERVTLGGGYIYSENDSSEDDFTIKRSHVLVRATANY